MRTEENIYPELRMHKAEQVIVKSRDTVRGQNMKTVQSGKKLEFSPVWARILALDIGYHGRLLNLLKDSLKRVPLTCSVIVKVRNTYVHILAQCLTYYRC